MALLEPEATSRNAAPRELYDTVVRAIVFTDVVGSTEVASQRGDLELLRLLERHDRLVERTAAAWSGEIVKSTGDGTLLAFVRPSFATISAVQIQRLAIDARVPLRIGVDYGPMMRWRDTDYRGLVVNVAARLCDLASPGEILLTERAARAAQVAGPTDSRAVRGVPEAVAVCSVDLTEVTI